MTNLRLELSFCKFLKKWIKSIGRSLTKTQQKLLDFSLCWTDVALVDGCFVSHEKAILKKRVTHFCSHSLCVQSFRLHHCQNHWTALSHNGVLELKKKFRGLAELRDLLTFSFSGSRVGVKTVSCASSPSPSWPSVLPPQAHTFDIKDINRSRKCFKILREFVIFVASPSPHLWKEDIKWSRKCLQILRQFVIFVASPGPHLPEEHKKRSRKGIKILRDAVNFVALLGPRPHSSK